MTTNINSRPRYELFGIKDNTARQPVIEPVSLPQHLPYAPTLAAWGTTEPTLFLAGGATKMYGRETFDEASIYATHATPYLNQWNLNTNAAMYHRMLPPEATRSIYRLSVEKIKTDVPVYERNEDGSIKYVCDNLNQKVPVVERTVIGTRLVYHLGVAHYPSDNTDANQKSFGNAKVIRDFRENTTKGSDGTQLGAIANNDEKWTSTLHPIFDLDASYFGIHGDDFGVRTILPSAQGTSPIDLDAVYSAKTYLWRLGLVERDRLTGGYNLLMTTDGSGSVDVSLKDNVRAGRLKTPMSIDKVFLPQYHTAATNTTPAFKGPFNGIHVYRDSLEELQTLLINGDATETIVGEAEFNDVANLNHGRIPLTNETQYLLNWLGGFDIEGVPYYAMDTRSSALFGGTSIVSDMVAYATGGSDGLHTNAIGEADELANYEMYDSLVRQQMNNFGEGAVRWMNTARYPVSAFWDTGFSMETKKAMLTPIGKRKDVATILATQSVADYVTKNIGGEIKQVWDWIRPNNEGEETSIAGALRTIASTYPESEIYGTGTCRAIIVGQCGSLLNSNFPHKLPLTYELADKVSKFMGRTDGFWDDAAAYDMSPNNILTKMTDINLSWKDAEVADKAWMNGLVYAEDYDINRQFFPAVRTVYHKESSILTGSPTMFAATYIQRVCMGAWRDLVGSSRFSREGFIQHSNEMISERLAKRFDDRFQIVVDTHFSKAAIAAGFIWDCTIELYGPDMMLVGRFTLEANNLEDFQIAA